MLRSLVFLRGAPFFRVAFEASSLSQCCVTANFAATCLLFGFHSTAESSLWFGSFWLFPSIICQLSIPSRWSKKKLLHLCTCLCNSNLFIYYVIYFFLFLPQQQHSEQYPCQWSFMQRWITLNRTVVTTSEQRCVGYYHEAFITQYTLTVFVNLVSLANIHWANYQTSFSCRNATFMFHNSWIFLFTQNRCLI